MTDLRQTADPEICAQWDWCPYCKNGLDTGLQCDQCLADLMPVQEALRELQRLRSSGGARAALNELHQMDQDMLGTSSGEPRGKPVPCWCPYCEQPHTPRIQEADPSPPTKPCSCQDTTESACGVAQGSVLGKLWHCRRSQLTKDGKL